MENDGNHDKYKSEANTGQATISRTPAPKQEKINLKSKENTLKSIWKINHLGNMRIHKKKTS